MKSENLPTGIFFGESSIVYGYQLLYQITKEPVYLEYAAKHCRITAENLAFDSQFDIVGGNAGAIMAFLNMYDFRKESCYLEMAEAAAEELLKHAVSAETGIGWKSISNGALLGGFAHGCAGIMYSLARLARYTGKADIGMRLFRHFCMKRLYIVRRKAVGGI